MLGTEELEDIARLKRLSLINAEKDYLQDILLFSIYSIVGRELVFKGGTCLYKIYKINGFSEDLDFTLMKDVNIEKINKKIMSNLLLLNIKTKIKEIKRYKNEINVKFVFNGPLYKGSKNTQCFIPLNISIKEKILLEAHSESISSLYKEIPNFDVFVMQEKEILAEKIRAISTRTKPRDVYDLWFLLTKKNTVVDLGMINRKLSLYNLKFNRSGFLKRIDEMEGLWNIDLKNLVIG